MTTQPGQIEIFLLGPPLITRDGQPLSFAYSRARALLAYLAIEADRPHTREALAMLLWPDMPDAAARTNLRQVLASLRQALGDEQAAAPLLLVSRDAVQFNRAAAHRLDVAELQALLDACAGHAHRHLGRCRSCAARMASAAALYRGDFLAGLAIDSSAPFAEWQAVLRERLHQRMAEAFAQLLAFHTHLGESETASAYARRLLGLEPWREETHRDLMRLLASAGQRSAALAQYELCRRALAEAFGADPANETIALAEAIRAGESSPVATPAALPPTLETSFVGRAAELEALRAMLEDPAHRLITIVGPGGSGKTRLALQAARELASACADGAAFVPLDGLGAPEQIASSALAALGAHVQGRRPPDEQLVDFLREREILLVLDNFEHLLAGADLLAQIIRAAPGATLLVTSRERLALRSEWIFDLGGLRCPPDSATDALADYDAVRLFVERARQVRRQFALAGEAAAVAQICQLVEGLPLALELAATTVRERGCAETAVAISAGIAALAADMRDLPARQRSIRATFDCSWRLLAPDEQRALRRLAVFRGGLSAEAAEQVAQASPATLEALVSKSLLRHSAPGRYALHELVRQYAAEQLAAAGETAQAQQHHLDFFLALAQRAEPELTGEQQAEWLQRLEAEHDNLRAALGWALAQGQRERAAALGGALWRFWWLRDYLAEGLGWLGQIVGADSAAPELPAELLAQALKGMGALANRQGDFALSEAMFRRELALRVALGAQPQIASVLVNLATTLQQQGDYAQAIGMLEQSIAIDRQLEDWSGLAYDLGALGQIAYHQGAYDRAHALLAESLVLHRQRGDTYSIAVTLVNLSSVAAERGNFAELERFGNEALQLYRAVNNRHGVAVALENLVAGRVHSGDLAQARAMLAESMQLYRELGARDDMLSALGAAAAVLDASGQLGQAARLLGAMSALYDADGIPLRAFERAACDATLAAARAQLGADRAAAAWAAGQSMTLDMAVGVAFAVLGEGGYENAGI